MADQEQPEQTHRAEFNKEIDGYRLGKFVSGPYSGKACAAPLVDGVIDFRTFIVFSEDSIAMQCRDGSWSGDLPARAIRNLVKMGAAKKGRNSTFSVGDQKIPISVLVALIELQQ